MQILLQWKQKVQTNIKKLPVLEMQLFIQFNKNQIYYVIHGKLEYSFMNFQTIQLLQDIHEQIPSIGGLEENVQSL